MSQEICSQEKKFKASDDLFFFNNLPKPSKRRSSILRTIDTNTNNDERRTSRRVSFANNLFCQELKPDGTTQLITEPFKEPSNDDSKNFNFTSNTSNTDIIPIIKSDKRRKSTKSLRNYLSTHYNMQDANDYTTVLNTSVNRTNAKKKFDLDGQKKDLNTLFCDEDMELTNLEKENSCVYTKNDKFKFENLNDSKLNYINSQSNSTKYFSTSNNMDLTNMTKLNESNLTNNTKIFGNSNYMDLTNLNDKSIQDISNCTKLFSSNSMDLTDVDKENEFFHTRNTQVFFTSKMDLTNLNKENDPSFLCNSKLQFTNDGLNISNTDNSIFPVKNPELNKTNKSSNTVYYNCSKNNDMDLTLICDDDMDLTNLSNAENQSNSLKKNNNTTLPLISINSSSNAENKSKNQNSTKIYFSSNNMDLTDLKSEKSFNNNFQNIKNKKTSLTPIKTLNKTLQEKNKELFSTSDMDITDLINLKSEKSFNNNFQNVKNKKTSLSPAKTLNKTLQEKNKQLFSTSDMEITDLIDFNESSSKKIKTAKVEVPSENNKTENEETSNFSCKKTEIFPSQSMELTNVNNICQNNTLADESSTLSDMDITDLGEKNTSFKKEISLANQSKSLNFIFNSKVEEKDQTNLFSVSNMELTDLKNDFSTINKSKSLSILEPQPSKSILSSKKKNLNQSNNCLNDKSSKKSFNFIKNGITDSIKIFNPDDNSEHNSNFDFSSPKVAKINTASSLKAHSISRRHTNANPWALKKEKIHSTLSFRNQSYFAQKSLDLLNSESFSKKSKTTEIPSLKKSQKDFLIDFSPKNFDILKINNTESSKAHLNEIIIEKNLSNEKITNDNTEEVKNNLLVEKQETSSGILSGSLKKEEKNEFTQNISFDSKLNLLKDVTNETGNKTEKNISKESTDGNLDNLNTETSQNLLEENLIDFKINDENISHKSLTNQEEVINELVKENSYIGKLVKENSYVGELVKENSYVGELVKENNYIGELVKENSYVGELVKENNYIGELVKENSYVDELETKKNLKDITQEVSLEQKKNLTQEILADQMRDIIQEVSIVLKREVLEQKVQEKIENEAKEITQTNLLEQKQNLTQDFLSNINKDITQKISILEKTEPLYEAAQEEVLQEILNNSNREAVNEKIQENTFNEQSQNEIQCTTQKIVSEEIIENEDALTKENLHPKGIELEKKIIKNLITNGITELDKVMIEKPIEKINNSSSNLDLINHKIEVVKEILEKSIDNNENDLTKQDKDISFKFLETSLEESIQSFKEKTIENSIKNISVLENSKTNVSTIKNSETNISEENLINFEDSINEKISSAEEIKNFSKIQNCSDSKILSPKNELIPMEVDQREHESMEVDYYDQTQESIFKKDLSVLEKEFGKETMNDSIFAFQTQTNYSSSVNTTDHQKESLEEKIKVANEMMFEKSLFTDFLNDAEMFESDKLKNFFSKHNSEIINLKPFNGHITLVLDLDNTCEDKFAVIKNMKLNIDFDKPKLIFWSDEFFKFYLDRPEHKNFVLILKEIIQKKFEKAKEVYLEKYNSTEFSLNIKNDLELLLNEISVFAKDIKITTLKFKNYEFKLKQDETIDFSVDLFGINKKFVVVLNIDPYYSSLSIKPRFSCWLDEKSLYPFDDIKSIVESVDKNHNFIIDQTIIKVNKFIRKIRHDYHKKNISRLFGFLS